MKPIVLCIMDGVGIRKESKGNAFKMAKKPNLDFLYNNFPHSLLEASGELVGLPHGQMGNSEVGHMNIGAGRIVYQPLELINKKIETKEFFKNQEFKNIFDHVEKNSSNLHIFGLLSDGGIHSHINHLFAIIDSAKNYNIKNIYLHMFLDGRDTLPKSALKYLDLLNEKIKLTNNIYISTISGRYYAMDRDNRWDRIELAYNAIIYNKGQYADNYKDALEKSYSNNETDEFVKPYIIKNDSNIKDNDGLILFNYRPDRGRELFSAITNPKFNSFKTKKINNIKLVTMMPLSDEVIYKPAFNHQKLNNTLGEYLSKKGYSQLRIAETEKYAHVTYFFDGGIEKNLDNCKRILIPSPKVATYDMKPEMSAIEITNKLIDNFKNYDVIILNYANGDMVGHTGSIPAAIKAVETVDKCIGILYEKIKTENGILIVTADHGNCDWMLDDNGNIITSHSTNPVPFIITDKNINLKNGKLADIAPTILHLLKCEIPSDMTGEVLINK